MLFNTAALYQNFCKLSSSTVSCVRGWQKKVSALFKMTVFLRDEFGDYQTLHEYDRYRFYTTGNCRHIDGKAFLKASLTVDGYRRWSCRPNQSSKHKHLRCGPTMLKAFVSDKPSEQHTADHIDGNRSNDDISNLRWATHAEQHKNKRYKTGVRTTKTCYRVEQCNMDHSSVRVWQSVAEAACTLHINRFRIMDAVDNRNRMKSYKGFIWQRVDVNRNKIVLQVADGEVWKEIFEAPTYFVSTFGRTAQSVRGQMYLRHDPILNPNQKTACGYYKVNYKTVQGKCRTIKVHILVADTFLSLDRTLDRSKYVVDHIDNNPLNNRLTNLQYLTRVENSRKGNRVLTR